MAENTKNVNESNQVFVQEGEMERVDESNSCLEEEMESDAERENDESDGNEGDSDPRIQQLALKVCLERLQECRIFLHYHRDLQKR